MTTDDGDVAAGPKRRHRARVRAMFALWGVSIAAAVLMYALGIGFERRGALVLLIAVGGPIWIPIGLLILWAVLRMDESTVHHDGGGVR